MQDFWFYTVLGFNHVADPGAYDHILFLFALAVPFTLKSWKNIAILATIFTITHCISLALGVYEIIRVNVALIEFFIGITIILTALFNIFSLKVTTAFLRFYLQILATAFFGLIHGFGFSSYFKMLMAGEEHQSGPLLGFATGIEISQLCIILFILTLASFLQTRLKVPRSYFVVVTSLIIGLITTAMLINTLSW
ncbi:MAG TPA: HupE/UreJ family protein [Eudoraea sp.]|nr:HupE/UreJ family protein [Eudoraea sp.]